jgi:predicted ATPase
VFARLGVFAGPFSLPAAEAVCASDEGQASGPGQMMEALSSLVDSSLVRAETCGGEPRFSLLETSRDYALERLGERGDWVPAHDRHAAYFQALAEPAAADLAGPGQLPWLDRLETEHDNLWATMSWLVDQGHLDQATHLFLMTWRFWWLRGHLAEFARLGDEIAAGSADLPPYQRATALTGAGFILIANGDPARAQTVFEQQVRSRHRSGVEQTAKPPTCESPRGSGGSIL